MEVVSMDELNAMENVRMGRLRITVLDAQYGIAEKPGGFEIQSPSYSKHVLFGL